MRKRRALVAMSGGVDSAVAAYLTKEQGYETVGITLSLCPFTKGGDAEEAERARQTATRLGIEHRTLSAEQIFVREVIDPFIASYEAGETPNPCLLCNRRLKFGYLFQYAKQEGFDLLVTGHYARIVDGRLLRARYEGKDQSYVLYFLTEDQLRCLSFPLGEFSSKEEVRSMAATLGLSTAQQRESQDICFIPDGDYGAFIERQTGRTFPGGDICSSDGQVLGRHRGLIHYTVGQRKGLGLAVGTPVYVKEKRADGTVVVAEETALYERRMVLRELTLSRDTVGPFICAVKPRYRAVAARATVTPLRTGGAEVLFDEPQRALTPGQAAVLYDGDTVLGGGIIEGIG